jgi:hypothetical protein
MRIAAFFAIVLLFVAGVTATQVSRPVTAEECDPNYTGACVPVGMGKVTCSDVGSEVTVTGTDVHGLDADKDGVGCEANERGPSGSSTSGSSNGASGSGANNGSQASSKSACKTVFVGGKGVVDSCSSEHKETSRVYPRKPGVPANGCVTSCPEAPAGSRQGTPGPAAPPASGTPRAVESTPVDTQYTAPVDLGPNTPVPAQNCDRVSYPDICVPPAPPYLSCSDIPDRNFRVRAPDPHRFDADNNGIGCEQVAGPSIGR